ncbi:ammonium transporter 3 member 1-like, partial [Trifolium medium]|nr:ammonium transporter 3 member 1-like [Trifolium medium]
MITGLVCITPAAGVVQGWASLIMGVFSGSIPWFTMMVIHKRSKLLQKVDDTMAVLHTHAIAGSLGGILTGLFAEPKLNALFYEAYAIWGQGDKLENSSSKYGSSLYEDVEVAATKKNKRGSQIEM